MPLPIILVGGIYSGYFAVSEAAAVAVMYVLIVDVLILGEIKIKQLPKIMRESMVLVGVRVNYSRGFLSFNKLSN